MVGIQTCLVTVAQKTELVMAAHTEVEEFVFTHYFFFFFGFLVLCGFVLCRSGWWDGGNGDRDGLERGLS